MQIPLSQVRNSLLSKVGGRAQANIPNFYALLQETVWTMMQRVDLPSAIRVEPFIAPLYTNSNWLVLPDDFSLDGLVAIRPQDYSEQTEYNSFIGTNQYNIEQFLYTSTISIKNGVQFLQTQLTLPTPIVVNSCDDQDNGTWSAVGQTDNVRIDTQTFMEGYGSVAFDAQAGSSNGVQNLSMTAVDVSDADNILIWLDSPIAVDSVRLTIGSSTADYYYQDISTTYFYQDISAGFNLLSMDLSSASSAGSPDLANIIYVKLEILDTLTSEYTFRLDSVLGMGDEFINLEYYSTSLFLDNAGHRINIPTADTDYLVMTPREYILFLRQFSEIANVDVRPAGAAAALGTYGGTRLDALYDQFAAEFPSRRLLKADNYASGRSGTYFFPGMY